MSFPRRFLLPAGLVLALYCGAGCGPGAEPPKPAPSVDAAEAPCPVCGGALAAEHRAEVVIDGSRVAATVCSRGCAARFEASPEKFAGK